MNPHAQAVIDMSPDWLDWVPADGPDGWGREWSHPPAPERLGDPEVYIHHTAGPRYALDPRVTMRTYQTAAHRRRYATVAYDQMVVMDKSTGRVAICEGRGGWRSAATRDRNEEGEAICLVGYFHPGHGLSERPHPREVEALAWAVAFSIASDWSASRPATLGHRDNPRHPGATACPGDYLYPEVPGIGRRAIIIAEQAANPPAPNPTPKPPQETDNMGTAMRWKHPSYADQFLVGIGGIERITPAMAVELDRRGLDAVIVESDHHKLLECVRETGIEFSDLTPT